MVWEDTLKKISNNTAFKAALQWADNPVNLQLVNNQINCVYRFESEGKGFYLRITHEKIRPQKELLAAIDFQQHLFQMDAPVCEVLKSKNGSYIETVVQEELHFLIHVCSEVPGTIMHFGYEVKNVYEHWGQALARLHRAAESYQANGHHFRSWSDLWSETADYLVYENSAIQDLFHTIDEHFRAFKINNVNFGLTHGDHRPGNVLFDGKQIHFIDFDEPVYHWFMADIAKPFLDLCGIPYSKWAAKFAWMIEGYQSIFPIDGQLLHAINDFSQMKSLDIYLWCKNNWHEPTAPGGKPREQWLNELRHMAFTPLFQL
ncbi:phosphotransferase [Fluoribacter gormanii]|uniref:Homoserine kinase n=1 Tax=Fluoribacter gormanii TaxID=464 RepID=A0A377GJD5_9GAMM|nr:phosphotransferase [Fluoribacter gormanii]KTD03425.1 homoserine kinase [Fluoribacter gormanii]MCW8469170.1 phosphotransferase [Fluoribacter gormanii]SIQ49417.1 Ser/Thr protein kinase RdoA involved in Cpx stress response, MazF antagonist [Fluoribacter gormanii]STO24452.1 homoserine kinase [Fluoribacter gormanii]